MILVELDGGAYMYTDKMRTRAHGGRVGGGVVVVGINYMRVKIDVSGEAAE